MPDIMKIVGCIISMLCIHAFWLPSTPVAVLEPLCIDHAPLDISILFFSISTIAILQRPSLCTTKEVDIRKLLHLLYIYRLDNLLVVV